MSVATPVLERKVSANENGAPQTTTNKSTAFTQEELHNSRIKDNYARLINPDYKIEDVFTPPEDIEQAMKPSPVVEERPVEQKQAQPQTRGYEQLSFVENARADADIFRADSEINRRQAYVNNNVIPETTMTEDYESEDLRPTKTTIQYRTRKYEAENIDKDDEKKKNDVFVNKKEKIIIATFISVVVALFVLVIVNSAIIASLNSDISALQEGLSTVKVALSGVNNDIAQIVSPENIADFAASHNLTLK
jgi:cell division protein FtsL